MDQNVQLIQVTRDYGNLPRTMLSNIHQAFMNILANAIDTLEASAPKTYQETKENPNRITIQTSIIDSEWVKIAISDMERGVADLLQTHLLIHFHYESDR
jgi:nitrogen-specific signal transduction histidine kinase